jgi:fatty-acyl-CoA synthase
MKSTMQDAPLLLRDIMRHGVAVYAEKKVFTVTPTGVEEATFAQIAHRA